MNGEIVGELRVKGGRQQVTLPGRDGTTVVQSCEHLRRRPDRLDDRGANEDRSDRLIVDHRSGDRRLERVKLRAKRIAAHAQIHQAEERLRVTDSAPRLSHVGAEEDHARAGPPDRHTVSVTGPDRIIQTGQDEQLADGRALAPWDDQAIDIGEVQRRADLPRRRAETCLLYTSPSPRDS